MSEDTKIALNEMAATITKLTDDELIGQYGQVEKIPHLEYRTTDLAGGLLSEKDHAFIAGLVGEHEGILRRPDLVIAPHGQPYIFRWYLVRDRSLACIYIHLQVADDPERPMHDHPWDNCTVLISGGYIEQCGRVAGNEIRQKWIERIVPGTVKRRNATDPHRLMLGKGVQYSVSIFTTGPRIRDWGYWTDKGWMDADDFGVTQEGNTSKLAE